MTHRTKINKALGKYGQLDPTTWRYKFIQLLGYIFWGRKLGYLSWWQHAARCAGVLFFHNGKLLLAKRSPHLPDRPNTYSHIGGFIDGLETYAQGVSREIKEECGLDIPPESFPHKNVFEIRDGIMNLTEQDNVPFTEMTFIYSLSEQQVKSLKTTSEVTEFLWVDQAMLEDLQARGLVAFQRERETMERVFAHAAKASKEKENQTEDQPT